MHCIAMVYSLESCWLLNYDVKSTELYCHVANKSMQELGWEFFGPLGLCSRFQHRRNFPLSASHEILSTAVHPSKEFLMQLLVVALFLVLLLSLYLTFPTTNFLLWLFNLQVKI